MFNLRKDYSGQRFGKLLAIRPVGKAKNRNILWECKCDCGNICVISQSNLINQGKQCSECSQKQRAKSSVTHGMSKTPTYKTWCCMIARCENPNDSRYKDWGGRGIKVDQRWKSFENFLADMGVKPEGKSIDRINNDGDYTKGNCKWSSNKEQSYNRRSNVLLIAQGKTLTLHEWSVITGIDEETIRARVKRGWTHEKALTSPVLHFKPRRIK